MRLHEVHDDSGSLVLGADSHMRTRSDECRQHTVMRRQGIAATLLLHACCARATSAEFGQFVFLLVGFVPAFLVFLLLWRTSLGRKCLLVAIVATSAWAAWCVMMLTPERDFRWVPAMAIVTWVGAAIALRKPPGPKQP